MQLSRSVVNRSIGRAQEVFERLGIHLPPFAFWTPEEWLGKGPEMDEVRDCMLGWDVTDFGSNDFPRIGRTLFTLRNGSARDPRYRKLYAEKYLLNPEGQRAPAHFHRSKMEDIVNRGGGNVLLQLWRAGEDNQRSEEAFTVQVDGRTVPVQPGGIVRITPGESITLPPRTVHQFWGEEGTGIPIDGIGYSVGGEVSSVCDDRTDNYFLEPAARFPTLIEDEPRLRFLCHEYPRAR